jgi:hypothetical protein
MPLHMELLSRRNKSHLSSPTQHTVRLLCLMVACLPAFACRGLSTLALVGVSVKQEDILGILRCAGWICGFWARTWMAWAGGLLGWELVMGFLGGFWRDMPAA